MGKESRFAIYKHKQFHMLNAVSVLILQFTDVEMLVWTVLEFY